MTEQPLLVLKGVHTHIGRYHILQGVDLEVYAQRVSVLLGRNGAGKTTTLRTILGLWHASAGEISFDQHRLNTLDPPAIARLGIAYVPENMGIFSGLSVRENLLLGTGPKGFRNSRLEEVLASFPLLREKWNLPAGTLSGGQKQILAIARAMMLPRRLFVVDEPTKGLAPAMVDVLLDAFLRLKEGGATILLVEQNFAMAATLGDDAAVMEDGRIVHVSSMAALAQDEALQTRLLGLSLASHQ
ncbi:MAG: ABC transporter ATP-binding protein [Acidobacteriia bacterium]|nr:ABC transporter ATP-binding protein [Methyloceanibacter sp.]MCL6490598.1 ABC transporter ATP-binding protein [Terriglobia bacterium]